MLEFLPGKLREERKNIQIFLFGGKNKNRSRGRKEKMQYMSEKGKKKQAHSGDHCELWETRWTSIHTNGTSVVWRHPVPTDDHPPTLTSAHWLPGCTLRWGSGSSGMDVLMYKGCLLWVTMWAASLSHICLPSCHGGLGSTGLSPTLTVNLPFFMQCLVRCEHSDVELGNSAVTQKAEVCSGQKTEFRGVGMLSTGVEVTSAVLATELLLSLSFPQTCLLCRFSFMMVLDQLLLRITIPLNEIQDSVLTYALPMC